MADNSNTGVSTGSIIGGAGIGAASSLVGGLINHVLGSQSEKEQWQRNYDAQKEFMQNSIQWRVQDAQAAGIHPLYALGNTPGYTPSSSFDTGSMGNAVAQAGNKFGDAMGQLGIMNAYLQNEKLQGEVKQQQLANQSKELELYNKALEAAMSQKPDIPAPVKVGDRMETEKGKVTLSPSMGYLDNFKRYGDGWIGYPDKDLMDAATEASIFNPLSLPIAVDAFDAMYRAMPVHFEKSLNSAIPGISKHGKVKFNRYLKSYGRPVYTFEFDDSAPASMKEAYRRLLGL